MGTSTVTIEGGAFVIRTGNLLTKFTSLESAAEQIALLHDVIGMRKLFERDWKAEIERLRTALAPFAKIASGIPDRWPGECPLKVACGPWGRDGRWREAISYHFVEDDGEPSMCESVVLPTIAEWREVERCCKEESRAVTIATNIHNEAIVGEASDRVIRQHGS